MGRIWAAIVFVSLAGCGGGGSSGTATAPASAAPAAPTVQPAIPKALPITIQNNVAAAHPLAHVRSWQYVINNQTQNSKIQRLAASAADLVVIDVPESTKGLESYKGAADVALLKSTRGAAGKPKIVLAYMDIGEAESYRTYWPSAWTFNATTPPWIVAADPDGYSNNYPVAFWNAAWQNIVFAQAGSMLDRVLADGYDGVYLDWVEAMNFAPVLKQAALDKVDATQKMIDFVAAMKSKARALNPRFLVVAQNATELHANAPWLSLLDGQAQEQIFFDGVADISGVDPRQGDCRLPLRAGDPMPASNASYCAKLNTMSTSSEFYVANLADYLRAGIPVFSVDYALQPGNAAFAYAQDQWFGFVGLATMRSLEDVTATPPL